MIVIDTNVLVYSTAPTSPSHAPARAVFASRTSEGQAVTRLILREYISATTRPQAWSRPFTVAEATADTDDFLNRFAILEDGPKV